MKTVIKSKIYILVLFLILTSFLNAWPTVGYAAGGAKLYVSPSSGNLTPGSSLTVDVRVDSGSNEFNTVKTTLSYSADKLDFSNITCRDSFLIIQCSGGNGTINIQVGSFSTLSGDQLIANLNFNVKASSGTASINFSSDSEVDNGGQSLSLTTLGGTYNVSSPPPAPPPATQQSDTIKPVIKNIEASQITTKSATITWQTSEPATSEISYGINTNYGLLVADDNLVMNHTLTLDSNLLRSGTTYHYRIKSVDAAGNASYSSDQTLTTQADAAQAKNQNQSTTTPSIFDGSTPALVSPHSLVLTPLAARLVGLSSFTISATLLLMSLEFHRRIIKTPVDRLLVSRLSKAHNKLLKRWLRTNYRKA